MKRLTKRQKAVNARKYATIRKYYEVAKTKMTEEQLSRITYKRFKKRVMAYSEAKEISIKEASKKVLNTEAFTSPAERSRVNLINAIKEKFPEQYKDIRQLSRNKRGQFTSVKSNLVWSKELGGYVLGGKYFIDVTNSPEDVIILSL